MSAVRYRVEHETRYAYDAPVSQSWQRARLTPRSLPWQRVLAHAIEIDPHPDERHDGPDAFGNTVTHFGLHGAHRQLRVRMRAEVEIGARPQLVPAPAQPWMRSNWPSRRARQHTPGRFDLSSRARWMVVRCFATNHLVSGRWIYFRACAGGSRG